MGLSRALAGSVGLSRALAEGLSWREGLSRRGSCGGALAGSRGLSRALANSRGQLIHCPCAWEVHGWAPVLSCWLPHRSNAQGRFSWLMLNSGLLSIGCSLRYQICMLENSQSDYHLKLSFSININIRICAWITGNTRSTIYNEKLQGGNKELSILISATAAKDSKHQATNCWGRRVLVRMMVRHLAFLNIGETKKKKQPVTVRDRVRPCKRSEH